MNDPQFFEAARSLAQNALHASKGDLGGEFNFLATRLLARPLESGEREIIEGSYKDYLNRFSSHEDEARKLLAVGESKADESLPVLEFAALTMVANEVMNLDEVLTK